MITKLVITGKIVWPWFDRRVGRYGTALTGSEPRALLRNAVTLAAGSAADEAGFFARLVEAGVLVRLRFSDTGPGQVTGYAVGLPGHDGSDGAPLWYGGGRLAAGLTLPPAAALLGAGPRRLS